MKLKLTYRKPAAYHLFYPEDSWTSRFLSCFNMHKPPQAFTINQIMELKSLGFEVEIQSAAVECPPLD